MIDDRIDDWKREYIIIEFKIEKYEGFFNNLAV